MDFSNETEVMNSGGMGRGFGGFGGGGTGVLDLALLALIFGDGFLGNKRRDNDCCPPPATCENVNTVDRDVLATANQIQHEICESNHDIEAAIVAGNTNLGDKVTTGFYALSSAIKDLGYAQQTTAKDTQTLIVEKFADLETKQLAAANCALEQEVNRYKTIEALCACKGKD